jgi:hypothetical protein
MSNEANTLEQRADAALVHAARLVEDFAGASDARRGAELRRALLACLLEADHCLMAANELRRGTTTAPATV